MPNEPPVWAGLKDGPHGAAPPDAGPFWYAIDRLHQARFSCVAALAQISDKTAKLRLLNKLEQLDDAIAHLQAISKP